jgi:uncharacterized protein
MLMSRLMARVFRLPPPRSRAVTIERDVAVPMDDGVELLGDLYTPAGPGPHPTILVRSPYGRAGVLGVLFGRLFAERGYRSFVQSTRGTFGSGGEFRPDFPERADGLATIRWIERQSWFDGRLAMNGPSYLGAVQWAVADDAGPSLRALCTHVTYSNINGYRYAGGSFALGDLLEWATMIAQQETTRFRWVRTILGTHQRRIDRVVNRLPVVELDQQVTGRAVGFWRDMVEHASCDDPIWAPIDHSARVPATQAPVLQVTGWYDIFLPIQLADHRALVAAGHRPRLVVGPWTHAEGPAAGAQTLESLRWLDRHLGRDGPSTDPDLRPVRIFVTGAEQWRDVDCWPPAGHGPERWHLHEGGRLDGAAPAVSEPDAYTYDPADPTPSIGGNIMRRSGGRRDQARTERRADVLTYTSEPLPRAVEVIGDVSAEVHVGSDCAHFDVFVRLCDVDAKGRSVNVCDGLQRVAPTQSPPPGGTTAVSVTLWPTAHRFEVGHRIRIQVASAAHPRYARNLGTGEPLATGTTMRPARITVHHDPDHPSAIVLPVGVPEGSTA